MAREAATGQPSYEQDPPHLHEPQVDTRARPVGMEETTVMVKIISSRADYEILGVHIVGPMAGELFAEAVLAMEFSASTEDIQRTIHAHPSLAEAVHEAALAVDKKALNFPNPP